MKRPLQVRFRRLDPTPALEGHIRALADRLDECYDRILGCRVTVEAPHQPDIRYGSLYRVRIRMTVPEGDLESGDDPVRHRGHHDPFVAVREAFRGARRQLEQVARFEETIGRR